MNIVQAKEEIKNTVKVYLAKDTDGNYQIPSIRQRPILLIGPPGVGKTQIMEQVSAECGIGLVSYTMTHHTRQSAIGLPMICEECFDGKNYNVTAYTMSEIVASVYRKIETGVKEGILFLDEINCVSETLMPAMLQFLQCKTFGNQKIPDGWIIVTAGNPPEYNRSVREFDMVTLDRVRYISVEADLDAWLKYAHARHVHGAVIGYLSLRPDNFYRVESDVDGMRFVTARGWEDLSELLYAYEKAGVSIHTDIIYEYIRHQDVADDMAAYYQLYCKYKDDYAIDDILHGDVPSDIYERLMRAEYDERITVVHLLLDSLENIFLQTADSGMLSQLLSNAFDFMESAFSPEQTGNTQEMLIFVTGLTLSKEIAVFLAMHRCEPYLRYNEELLVGSRRGKLLAKLDS